MPHIHPEANDFVVDVYIVYRNKVFLRMHDKYHIWLSPGGHIELNEDPNEAIIREAREETGLEIKLVGNESLPDTNEKGYRELLAPRYLNVHSIREPHKHISMVYFATSNNDKVIPSGNDKSDNWKWFSMEELNNPIYNLKKSVKFYARKALEELSKQH